MIGAGGGRKIGEELREVRVRLDAVRFCRFDEPVQAGARGGDRGTIRISVCLAGLIND